MSELKTMSASDVITELNTNPTWYYNKFTGEQRMIDYNSSEYIWKDVYDWDPYEWTAWSIYYTIADTERALDSNE
jgi:hypothetical protein